MSFIVYGLPRSRTYWVSKFLTYGGWECSHEQMRYVRGMEDVRSWLSQEWTGTCETLAARWWRVVQHCRPDLRVVVIRRPVEEVVESLMRVPGCGFDAVQLTQQMRKLDRALDLIEDNVPSLGVDYADLADEAACARIFEHCLPFEHDHDWWATMAPINAQANVPAQVRYMAAHKRQLDRTARVCRRQMYSLLHENRRPEVETPEGMVIQPEPFATFWRDGKDLLAEHCVAVDQSADAFFGKNDALARSLESMGLFQVITARSNGRIFGYLMAVLAPSAVHPDRLVAEHAGFYASPDAPRLGLALQRASIEALRARGVSDIFWRAGVVGDGPRLGKLYRHLGAKPFGELYRLAGEDG